MLPEHILQYQKLEIQEFVGLTPGETETHEFFERLAFKTLNEMDQQGAHVLRLQSWPESAGFGGRAINRSKAIIPGDLVDHWKRFEQDYPALVERNPRLELRNLLQTISERKEGASWPYMFEWAIEKWVAEGMPQDKLPYPIDTEFHRRLKELHAALQGWVYHDEEKDMVVFAELGAFHQVKINLDAAREEKIREEKNRIEESRRQSKGQPYLLVKSNLRVNFRAGLEGGLAKLEGKQAHQFHKPSPEDDKKH